MKRNKRKKPRKKRKRIKKRKKLEKLKKTVLGVELKQWKLVKILLSWDWRSQKKKLKLMIYRLLE